MHRPERRTSSRVPLHMIWSACTGFALARAWPCRHAGIHPTPGDFRCVRVIRNVLYQMSAAGSLAGGGGTLMSSGPS